MKVTIAATTYSVWWEHEDYYRAASMWQFWQQYCLLNCQPFPPPPTETTTCLVTADFPWVGGTTRSFTLTARVRRHRGDPFNKNKARKFALAKLLREQWPDRADIRAAFWAAYREQLGHW